MERLVTLQDIFKSSVERTVSHLNDTILRNTRTHETASLVKERDFLERIRQIEVSIEQLDHNNLVNIFSNRTMTLRHDIINKMIEMKEKFKTAQRVIEQKQYTIEENAQNFMKKVQNSMMDIKQDYATLNDKTSQLVIANADLTNQTQTVKNEYRDGSRQTKVKLSDLDDQIFNGLRNLRDEKDKLSAEIALQDGILVYLRENTVKITDSVWIELLEMREAVENLNQNADSLQSKATDTANIITANVEKKLSSQREKLLSDMGKLLAQVEKVKIDMQQQGNDLNGQIEAQQVQTRKSLADLQTTVEAEIIRRVKVNFQRNFKTRKF